MHESNWTSPLRGPLGLLLSLALVSMFALAWLGSRLLQQDRELEAQRLQEILEVHADRTVNRLQQTLAESERALADPAAWAGGEEPDQAIIAVSDGKELDVYPTGGLLFYAARPAIPEAPLEPFVSGERLEFQNRNLTEAVRAYQSLAQTSDPATRAGALLRIARVYRKQGRSNDALAAYSRLTAIRTVGISGLPAEVVARRARCALLEAAGDVTTLKREATELCDHLLGGRWKLSKEDYEYVSQQALGWGADSPAADPIRVGVAVVVTRIWNRWISGQLTGANNSGRLLERVRDRHFAVLWHRAEEGLSALVAGPGFQLAQWLSPALSSVPAGQSLAIVSPDGDVLHGALPQLDDTSVTRHASLTGLPWDVVVFAPAAVSGPSEFARRRQLLLGGLGILAVLVVVTSYLSWRAVSRELAVARLQSDFVSAVSHEFRTPLTSLRQFTELLLDDERASAAKRRSFHEGQLRATDRLQRLVESLLDFGRMEADARPYRLEPIDVGELVRSIVASFRKEAESSGVGVECSLPESELIVDGDRGRAYAGDLEPPRQRGEVLGRFENGVD